MNVKTHWMNEWKHILLGGVCQKKEMHCYDPHAHILKENYGNWKEANQKRNLALDLSHVWSSKINKLHAIREVMYIKSLDGNHKAENKTTTNGTFDIRTKPNHFVFVKKKGLFD